uniref:Uncharacterized protein n=1 Tax=Romanomermis culicivorax TaxID=13658 RepID=A0A915HL01_ROMCU
MHDKNDRNRKKITCYPPKVDNDQYAGISYDTENRYIVTTVLRNYHQWIVQIYERKGMRLRAETSCPTEPKIQNSWYRWVTCLGRGYALISTGDKRQSVIWLLNLHNHKWSVLLVKQNATFRKASFHQSSRKWPENRQREGLVYVPDMKNKTIVTFLLDTHAWTISKIDEIKTTEFARELPITVNAKGGKLVVGYWNTGNVIFADLIKSTSITLTSVGPREIFSICFLDTLSILVLCKQREVVEMYKVG